MTRNVQWDIEEEQYQWLVSIPLTGEDKDAEIYVREKEAPADVRIWDANGERLIGFENSSNWNKKYPFLFQSVLSGRSSCEAGNLDEKSKAMLKDRFNVDVDADG